MAATVSSPRKRSAEYRGIHPKRFMLYLYLVSALMIFAGLTSALLVSKADAEVTPRGWAELYTLPGIFFYSTGFVVLSSIALQWAFGAAKRDQKAQMHLGLGLALALGIAFLVGQYLGVREMLFEKGLVLAKPADDTLAALYNVSAPFVYVLTGMHALHLLGAVVALLVLGIQAARNQIHSKNLLSLELTTTFWHALGFLWVYLFVFLKLTYDA